MTFMRVFLRGILVVGCCLGVTTGRLGADESAARPRAPAPAVTVVLDEVSGSGRLAVTSNGQTLACSADAGGAIVAIDPADPPTRRTIVAAAADAPQPLALAFIDTGVLAAVCRAGDDWSLRTWRLQPGRPADSAVPLQTIPLGTTAGPASEVRMAMSRSRDWLVVAGLPEPLAPVLRAPLAGVRVGPLSARHCPTPGAGFRPVAVTVGPLDQLVLVERSTAAPRAGDILSFHDLLGNCLLRLDTGLTGIRDAAFAAGDGGLWVVTTALPVDGGSNTGAPAGLWRLDATLHTGRQAIRPVSVLPLADADAVACPTSTSVVVSHVHEGRRRVSRLSIPAGDSR